MAGAGIAQSLQNLPKDDIGYFFAALAVVASHTATSAHPTSAMYDSEVSAAAADTSSSSTPTTAPPAVLHRALEKFRMAATNLPTNLQAIADTRLELDAALRTAGLLEQVRDRVAGAASVRGNASAGAKSGGAAAGPGKSFTPSWMQKSCYVQNDMHLVAPGLYCGSYHPAADRELMKSNGITHICCCIGVSARFPSDFSYHIIPADDSPGYDISQHFLPACAFIDGAVKRGGKVLVHCGAGISRAPTILSAYLIQQTGMPHLAVVQMVRDARPCASPNSGFMRQLNQWSMQLRKERAATSTSASAGASPTVATE
jgi:hypothetical protein